MNENPEKFDDSIRLFLGIIYLSGLAFVASSQAYPLLPIALLLIFASILLKNKVGKYGRWWSSYKTIRELFWLTILNGCVFIAIAIIFKTDAVLYGMLSCTLIFMVMVARLGFMKNTS